MDSRQINATSTVDVTYAATFEHGTGTIHAVFVKSQGNWQLNQLQVNSPEFSKDLSTAVCPKCGAPYAEDAKFWLGMFSQIVWKLRGGGS